MTTPDPITPERVCGVYFGRHPTQPHLIAICQRPAGHEGEHSNVLPKAGQPHD